VERRCDAGLALRGVEGELEEEFIQVSSFGVCTTHSQSSNELVSLVSSELTGGARSAWRRARNSSCDALVEAEVGPEEESLEVSWFGVCTTHSQSSNELVSFASSEQARGARWAWRRARSSSCDALAEAEVGPEEDSLEEASFGARSAGRNELVSFASSEQTRGARWAWRRARSSSCDAEGVIGSGEGLVVSGLGRGG
jgi:hypothetical protein